MWSVIHGRLYHSPLEDSKLRRALDIGTGRGLWAMEFGMSLDEPLFKLIQHQSPRVTFAVQALANHLSALM